MTDPGFDAAEFHCGRCGGSVTASDPDEFIKLVNEHRADCQPQLSLFAGGFE